MQQDQFRLDGRNIIITGASSGIGRQCAIECSRRGAKLVLLARNEINLQKTLEEMSGKGHRLVPLDLTRLDKFQEQLTPVMESLGEVHGLVHSAGTHVTASLARMKMEKQQAMFDLNYHAAMEMSKLVTQRKYIAEAGTSLVFVAAVLAIRGGSAVAGYSGSKGALISAARSLAVELAPKKVRVNCVSPGFILTDLVQDVFSQLDREQINRRKEKHLLGFGNPQDVANACVYLLSDASRWVTGINLVVDGGVSVR
ncbi:MAG: SDR family NAD(P)-dependent oxidoreductase [Candidatus Cloacimonetes bacterium]|nr:SDR family NAD(P)-dependent oxidoreductase [Candidatus Cloacimonadota bacterium]